MIVETAQIIKAAKEGDLPKVLTYANLMADNLEKEGRDRQARIIRRAISGEKGPLAAMDSTENGESPTFSETLDYVENVLNPPTFPGMEKPAQK